MDVDKLTHAVGVVHGGAAVGDLDVAPAAMRIEGDEEIDGAVAAILVVVALALSRLGRDRLAHLADQLDGGLVEANQRPGGIRHLGVEIEHVLHAGDERRASIGRATYSPSTWGMHHMSLRHGLRSFSASRRRTVSPDRLSCSVSLTIVSASSVSVQRLRPVGGLAHAVATSRASSLPVSLRSAPGRGSSLKARSRLPSTKRRLVR